MVRTVCQVKILTTLMPFDRCHLSQTLLSSTGTSTACNVFGLSREPGLSAPHPAAHPYFPKNSSFFSGRQIGAKNKIQHNESIFLLKYTVTPTYMRHIMNSPLKCQHRNIKTISLRCKFKVWMNINLTHPECIRWQWLNRRIYHIITCSG